MLSLLIIRFYHISVSWSFTGDWVTASLLKSPGLFSVFWPFSIMLLFWWSPLGCQLPNLPGPLIILYSYRAKSTNHNWYNCHLYIPLFFQFSSKVKLLISLFTFFQFYSMVRRDSKVDNFTDFLFFFLLIIIRSGLLAEIRWSVFISKSHWSLCVIF